MLYIAEEFYISRWRKNCLSWLTINHCISWVTCYLKTQWNAPFTCTVYFVYDDVVLVTKYKSYKIMHSQIDLHFRKRHN